MRSPIVVATAAGVAAGAALVTAVMVVGATTDPTPGTQDPLVPLVPVSSSPPQTPSSSPSAGRSSLTARPTGTRGPSPRPTDESGSTGADRPTAPSGTRTPTDDDRGDEHDDQRDDEHDDDDDEDDD